MPARAIIDDREAVRLPDSQLRRIQAVRDKLLTNLADATRDLGAGLDRDVATVVDRIKSSGYSETVIRREVRSLMERHHTELAKVLSGQIKHAALMASRYGEIMAALPAGGEAMSGSSAAFLLGKGGAATARQSIAAEILLSQPAQTAARMFAGDNILTEHVRPWREARVLSRSLHGRAVSAADAITEQALAAVREAKQLTESTTSMIRAVRSTGKGELGGSEKLSAIMRRVEKAGGRLNSRGGEDALAEWRATRKQMRAYMRRLADGGRTKSSMLELLQRTSEDSAKGIDRAITQHAAFKQKYNAERILKTETMGAFKADQVLEDQKHDFVVGYIWRMNRGARASYVKRTTGKGGRIIGGRSFRKGGRRRRCVCESLNGKRLSKEAVAGRNARLMAHPHCMCTLEPVVDRRILDVAQASDFD